MNTKRESGFSLTELMVCVVILLILTIAAIPAMSKARMAANESSALSSLRTMFTASAQYNASWYNGWPPTLSAIGTTGVGPTSCTNAGLIDSVLTSGTKSGYTFHWFQGQSQLTTTTSACSSGMGFLDGFAITATPVQNGTTGSHAFCIDASGVIRTNSTGAIGVANSQCLPTDSVVQ